MPPKKRAAASGAEPSSTKRVRISNDTAIIGQQASDESHASGRPKRTPASDTAPVYNPTRPRASTNPEPNSQSTSTRPVGRPKGYAHSSSTDPAPSKPKRGRPRTVPDPSPSADITAKRGRPESRDAALATSIPTAASIPRKRGRPSLTAADKAIASSSPKKIGRPKKSPNKKFTHTKTRRAPLNDSGLSSNKSADDERISARKALSSRPVSSKVTKNARGRPKKAVSVSRNVAASSARFTDEVAKAYETDLDDVEIEDKYEDEDGHQYWLMKAEPQSRIEKGSAQTGEGKDVKFSIDDLRKLSEPEGWDGVRNPAARNNMRAMKVGDLAFFYHSNTKIPGIAGIMEIVREHSVDASAHDPASPYYDPKSTPDKPRWDLVHVSFRRKFPELISLKELQKYAKSGGALEEMQVLRQTRLSVSKVSVWQWEFIMGLVGDEEQEDENDEEEKIEEAEQEATNGETGVDSEGDRDQDELANGEITTLIEGAVTLNGTGAGTSASDSEIRESQEIPSSAADKVNDTKRGVTGDSTIQGKDDWFEKTEKEHVEG